LSSAKHETKESCEFAWHSAEHIWSFEPDMKPVTHGCNSNVASKLYAINHRKTPKKKVSQTLKGLINNTINSRVG
jgi:hypothetical protein